MAPMLTLNIILPLIVTFVRSTVVQVAFTVVLANGSFVFVYEQTTPDVAVHELDDHTHVEQDAPFGPTGVPE